MPDYEEAFDYLSRAAWRGDIEAKCTLAEMYKNGCVAKKDEMVYQSIISDVYKEMLPHAAEGRFNNGFAEVAFRNALIEFENENYYYAANYCLQAEYAVKRRMEQPGYFDNKVLAKHIEKLKRKIRPEIPRCYLNKRCVMTDPYLLMKPAGTLAQSFEADFKKTNDNRYRITFRVRPIAGEEYAPKLFVSVSRALWCGMLDEVTFEVDEVLDKDRNRLEYDGKTVVFDSFS